MRAKIGAAVVSVVLLVAFTWPASAATARGIGVTSVRGDVSVMLGKAGWKAGAVNQVLRQGDSMKTGKTGQAVLTVDITDKLTVRVMPNTEALVKELSTTARAGRVTTLFVKRGSVQPSLRKLQNPDSRFTVTGPTATTVVRGTEFSYTVAADGTTSVVVLEGVVAVTAGGKTVVVSTGQATNVAKGGQPAEPVSLDLTKKLELKIQSPQDKSVTPEARIQVKGVAAPGATIMAGENLVVADAAGAFVAEVELKPGENSIEVVATSVTGETQAATVSVRRASDTEPPKIELDDSK